MPESAGNVIRHLKIYYQVDSDKQLASKLGISSAAISNWRHEEKVPERILRIYDKEVMPYLENLSNVEGGLAPIGYKVTKEIPEANEMLQTIYENEEVKLYVVAGIQYRLDKKVNKLYKMVTDDGGVSNWVEVQSPPNF